MVQIDHLILDSDAEIFNPKYEDITLSLRNSCSSDFLRNIRKCFFNISNFIDAVLSNSEKGM